MIYDQKGRRKYLTLAEREAFVAAAAGLDPSARTFCLVLTYTGARISEILALTPERVDVDAGVVIIESLKKRRGGVFRSIPVPRALLRDLNEIHELSRARPRTTRGENRVWRIGRTTAWSWVKQAMESAGIVGSHAMPKALRHAFGIEATQRNVPLSVVQKWLGHSRLSTTAIYVDAVGDEEREFASRLWHNLT
ncbi:integrase family protein [Parvibaculum lavamentivorans DS-1]|uniref:Integrase family protein n=1 Tax=Parvibaculum lavamentivorans (strain DS-1 / DSM 13023 / NCIMB 13966) TaxID=402881 RepID=A7HPX0_PARL1|nr:tyrosine-type recombinase/integrase [Parvibaculum lavamentivorans]ABS61953.1 integrase family protein [Parvibaculum lavamentivorans DS-1]